MKIPVKALVLALPFVAVFGAVYWLGASQEGPQIATLVNGLSGSESSAASAGGQKIEHRAASTTPPAAQGNEASLPEKVQLTEQERQFILTEFFTAAEKDVKRLQADISRAKAEGMVLADIATKEEKLRQMQQVIQQVRARHPGF